MTKFEVRVVREVPDEEVTLEIEAETPEEAKRLALEDAKRNEDLYFGPIEVPALFADDPEPMEEEAE
jgi:hypothetical protein